MVFKQLPVALAILLGSLPLNITGTEVTGNIEGKVRDKESMLPLPGARIHIIGTERVTESDTNGYFILSHIEPATYEVNIRLAGYQGVTKRGITVSPDEPLFLDIALQEDIEIIYAFDEIVVTASRISEKISTIDGSLSVVHKGDIERLPAQNVVEIIDILPGFQSYTVNGNDMTPGINVRGFTGGGLTDYLQVLIDGRPINDLETGLVNWNMIPVGDIEKIEVLRGPSSALYGDMAVGGVINVITEEPQQRTYAEVTIHGGSYGEYGGRLKLKNVYNSVAWTLSGSRQRIDGWREHSQWRRDTYDGSIGVGMGKAWQMSLSVTNQRLKFDIPGPLTRAQLQENREQTSFSSDRENQRRHMVFLTFDRERQGGWEAKVSFFFNSRDADIIRTLFVETKEQEKDVQSLGASVQYSRAIPWEKMLHTVVFGTELEGGRMTSSYFDLDADGKRIGGPSVRGSGKRTRTALYLQDKINPVERISLILGLRWDGMYDTYDGEFGSRDRFQSDKSDLSTKIGTNWNFTRNGRIYANMSRAFKAPTLEQLFDQRPVFNPYGNGFLFLSNSELKPQKGTNYELGMNWKWSPLLETHVAVYRMNMKDEIDFDLGRLQYANIGQSRHQGFESELQFYPSPHISSFLHYTYTEATFTSGEHQGNQINTIPHHLVHIGFLFRSDTGVGTSVLVNSVKDQYLDGGNNHPLADYTTVDVRVSYEREPVHVSIDVRNIFDREYNSFGYIDPLTEQEMLFPVSGRTLRGEVKVAL